MSDLLLRVYEYMLTESEGVKVMKNMQLIQRVGYKKSIQRKVFRITSPAIIPRDCSPPLPERRVVSSIDQVPKMPISRGFVRREQ